MQPAALPEAHPGRGSNFRKSANSGNRFVGSPAAKEVKDGKNWDMTPTKTHRTNNNSPANQALEEAAVQLKEKESEIAELTKSKDVLESKVQSLERSMSLRHSSAKTARQCEDQSEEDCAWERSRCSF